MPSGDTEEIVIPVTALELPSFAEATVGRPALRFVLTSSVPSKSFLRVRAGSVSMILGIEVTGVNLPEYVDAVSVVHRFSREEMELDWSRHIQRMSLAVVQTNRELSEGTTLEVSARFVLTPEPGIPACAAVAATSWRRPAELAKAKARYKGIVWRMSVGQVEEPRGLDFLEKARAREIRFCAGEAERMEAYLKPDGRLLVQHFDAFGNPACGGAALLLLTEKLLHHDSCSSRSVSDSAPLLLTEKLLHHNSCSSRSVSGTVASHGEATVNRERLLATEVSVSRTRPLETRIQVHDEVGRKAFANAPPYALDSTPIFFGEFHWHTDFSGDGERAMEDALKSSRDELGLDFAGPADHMGRDGRYAKRTPGEQAAICKAFDDPGLFCTIPGAELSRPYGHANLYTDSFDLLLEITEKFSSELAPAWQSTPDRYGLEALIKLCTPGRALVVPHHSNMDSYVRERVKRADGRPVWCAMHWPLPADREIVRLIEIVQCRGSFEAEETDADWRIYDGGLGGSAQTALMRGYRIGFIGGTDNHCGWPTREGAAYCGLTAVQAASLDTQSVFKALHQRQCYATSGARIVADATLNNHAMGSELLLEPCAERRFHIRIQGTAPLVAVQIIHFGYVLADFPVEKDSWDFEIEWSDQRPGRPLEDAYYYVRARQSDGHCIWMSPFWVDLP